MRTAALVLLAVVLSASVGSAQEPSARIKAEIDRLNQSLKAKPVSNADFAAVNGMVEEALKSAAEALNTGQLYRSLEQLAQAENLLRGGQAVDEKFAAVKGSLPAFESEWNKASLQLTAFDEKARQTDWSHVPFAVRALAEAAQGRSIPLLDGSRGFATSTKPQDGLFYMGQAQGEAEFANFCASLQMNSKHETFPLRSFLPELQKLQGKTNAAFQPPKSIDQHSRFIALNSALKAAEELDSQKFYAGSLYQYLEATRHYGVLDATVPDAAAQGKLKQSVQAALKKLDASSRDDSIAQIFLERAASQVAHADGSAPTPDEWKSAQVILDQVLPAYFAAEKSPTPIERASARTVTLTLVRWPYT